MATIFFQMDPRDSSQRPMVYQHNAAHRKWRPAQRKSNGVLSLQPVAPFGMNASKMAATVNVAGKVPEVIAWTGACGRYQQSFRHQLGSMRSYDWCQSG